MKKIFFHADDFGRSKNISITILKCLKMGNLNSTSIIINHKNDYYHKKLKKLKNINKRLHLNLTETSILELSKKPYLENLSFIKLLFITGDKRKKILQEVESQIKRYKKIYNEKFIKIDGHEHVHIIPWILKHLIKIKKKYNIVEFRNPNEIFMTPTFEDLFKYKYYRNLMALFVLKFLYYYQGRPQLTKTQFSGMIYSGVQNINTVSKSIDFLKKIKCKNFEIVLHPGFTNSKEIKLFKNNHYNFNLKKNRNEEFNLCFSKEIKKKLFVNN
jgi:predicted glycoside hydrolase/deacetylase ChbG (UPF0249 family)